jgi:hypothetical protein
MIECLTKVCSPTYYYRSNAQEFPSNEISTTKYTYWNFIFKNIFEQFRRYQNFYFLLVCVPTVIPGIAPISPASAVLPFLLILAVAACKEAYEDFVCSFSYSKC